MIGPDAPRRYGLTARQTIGIIVACTMLLTALMAMLPEG